MCHLYKDCALINEHLIVSIVIVICFIKFIMKECVRLTEILHRITKQYGDTTLSRSKTFKEGPLKKESS